MFSKIFSLALFLVPLIICAQPAIPTDTGMVNAHVDEMGKLQITAAGSSNLHDFDFFYGSWKVNGTRLKTRLHNSTEWIPFTAKLKCSKIIQGTGNIEPFFMTRDGQDFEAFTLRLFDAKTKCWSIYYAWPGDVSMQNPQVGSFQNDIGWFYSRDTWEGKPIIIVYRWDRRNPNKPTMCQAFSTDDGKTWEWNYLQSFERIPDF